MPVGKCNTQNQQLIDFKGTYDASNNTPTLTNGSGTPGDFYYVNVAGTDNPTGENVPVGNIMILNSALVWQSIPLSEFFGSTDNIVVAPDYVVINGEVVTIGQSLTQALGVLQGQIFINQPMSTLGDIIRGGASGLPTRLAGNATTTSQFLKSVGDGVLATAPIWAQITAPDILYIAPYTGGAAQTLAAKLAQSVSVIDLGATGDGSTLDTSSFQNAVNSGRAVYVPKPSVNYACGTITIPANTIIFGDGAASLIFQAVAPSASQGLFYVNSGSSGSQVSNIQIYNLGFLGKSVASGLNQFLHLISLNGVNNVEISGCYIAGFQGDGVYIGSGNIAGQERHNTNVSILNNTFDGLNNHNRNGTTVIDGSNILIDGNTYQNCTDATMPGAIDIEPDGYAFNIIQNIRITNNHFYNVTGNVGAITCALSNFTYTTPPNNILIEGNTFNVTSTTFVVAECKYYATQGLNLNIINNSGKCNQGFQLLTQPSDIKIIGNNFDQSSNSFIGFDPATDFIRNCLVVDNKFYGPGGSVGGISVVNCTNTTIKDNIFNNFSYGMTIGNASSTITNLTIGVNTYINTATATLYNGGATLSTCQYQGTIGTAVNNFPAFITNDCGQVTNGTSATSFNSATLPNSFGVGISTAIINGDTGVPLVDGAYQGTLINYKFTSTSGYQKYQYQTYIPADNGTTLNAFYVRQATGSNTWTAFSLLSATTTGPVVPVLTCGTPGDLAVTYSTQTGIYYRNGNQVTVSFSIVCSAFTWTTASGGVRITGLPFLENGSAIVALGSCVYRGLSTLTGYTIVAEIDPSTQYIQLIGTAVGQTPTAVTIANIASGQASGSVRVYGSISYFV